MEIVHEKKLETKNSLTWHPITKLYLRGRHRFRNNISRGERKGRWIPIRGCGCLFTLGGWTVIWIHKTWLVLNSSSKTWWSKISRSWFDKDLSGFRMESTNKTERSYWRVSFFAKNELRFIMYWLYLNSIYFSI